MHGKDKEAKLHLKQQSGPCNAAFGSMSPNGTLVSVAVLVRAVRSLTITMNYEVLRL